MVALGLSFGMSFLLSLAIFGCLLVKTLLYNCKVWVFIRKVVVLVMKLELKSITGLGFSKHSHMMDSRGNRGCPLIDL